MTIYRDGHGAIFLFNHNLNKDYTLLSLVVLNVVLIQTKIPHISLEMEYTYTQYNYPCVCCYATHVDVLGTTILAV